MSLLVVTCRGINLQSHIHYIMTVRRYTHADVPPSETTWTINRGLKLTSRSETREELIIFHNLVHELCSRAFISMFFYAIKG